MRHLYLIPSLSASVCESEVNAKANFTIWPLFQIVAVYAYKSNRYKETTNKYTHKNNKYTMQVNGRDGCERVSKEFEAGKPEFEK